MKKLVKLAVATAVVFGASSAMAECTQPGILLEEGQLEATLGQTCCYYDADVVLQEGIVKDAEVVTIVDGDGVPVSREAIIKCVPEGKQKPTKPSKDDSAIVIKFDTTGDMCLAPKKIQLHEGEGEEPVDVESDHEEEEKDPTLSDFQETDIFTNTISATGIISLSCTIEKGLGGGGGDHEEGGDL